MISYNFWSATIRDFCIQQIWHCEQSVSDYSRNLELLHLTSKFCCYFLTSCFYFCTENKNFVSVKYQNLHKVSMAITRANGHPKYIARRSTLWAIKGHWHPSCPDQHCEISWMLCFDQTIEYSKWIESLKHTFKLFQSWKLSAIYSAAILSPWQLEPRDRHTQSLEFILKSIWKPSKITDWSTGALATWC